MSAIGKESAREYTGKYRWERSVFFYRRNVGEFSRFRKPKLVSFNEFSDVRTLYPTDRASSSPAVYKVRRKAISSARSCDFRFKPNVWPGMAFVSRLSGRHPPGTCVGFRR